MNADGDLSSDDINMNTTVQSEIVGLNTETQKYETIFHAGVKLMEAQMLYCFIKCKATIPPLLVLFSYYAAPTMRPVIDTNISLCIDEVHTRKQISHKPLLYALFHSRETHLDYVFSRLIV